jgi:hypothetical protein
MISNDYWELLMCWHGPCDVIGQADERSAASLDIAE